MFRVKTLLRIAHEQRPLEMTTDAERMRQLEQEGWHLWPACGEMNNCLLDSLLLGLAGNGLLPENILRAKEERAEACFACRQFLRNHSDASIHPRVRTRLGEEARASAEAHGDAYLQSHLHARPALDFFYLVALFLWRQSPQHSCEYTVVSIASVCGQNNLF